jgi:hypothetical protein
MPSFEFAVQQWQADVLAGVYAPKSVAPLLSSSSSNTTFRNWHLKVPFTAAAGGSSRAVSPNSRRGSPGAAPQSPTSSSKAAWVAQPIMFHGTGPAAIEALEELVLGCLVQKPNLTLLQLQGAVGVLSDLATEEQLAAVALLLRGGFWMSALQVGWRTCSRAAVLT